LYYSQGRAQEALAQWREALRVDPNFLPAMNEAAHALAASPNASDRNGAEAVKFAERAAQLSGARNPVYLDTRRQPTQRLEDSLRRSQSDARRWTWLLSSIAGSLWKA
jgi:tetratricopeptide (TPR) repeat protein